MNLLCRMVVLAVCAFAAWWSVRMGLADWLSDSDEPDGLARAVQLEPGDARLVAIHAIIRSDNGDLSPAADDELRRASQLNPLDSTVWMTLGLRAEARGDQPEAERLLTQAAAVDRQFKPAWALANYYVRTGRTEKIWPLVERMLRLDPLGFDSTPIFDLCWNSTSDADRIFALVPKKRPRLMEYLAYLIRTGRVDAATRAWKPALSLVDSADPQDTALLVPYCAFLVNAGRIGDAVSAWNDLAAKSFVHGKALDPERGVSIADPGFAFPLSSGAFLWQAAAAPGLFVRELSPHLQLELDGQEPESFGLLAVAAPVLPSRKYRLTWQADASRLAAPDDPGFAFHIAQGTGIAEAQCPLLANAAPCTFTTQAGVELLRITLSYVRAPGTVRAKGYLRLLSASLEFAP